MQCSLSSTSIVCRSKWPLTYFPRHVWPPPTPNFPSSHWRPTDAPRHLLQLSLRYKPYEVSMFTASVLYGHAWSIPNSHRWWRNHKQAGCDIIGSKSPQRKKGSVTLSFFCLLSQRAVELMLCSWGPLSQPNVCAARGSSMNVEMDWYISLYNIWPFWENWSLPIGSDPLGKSWPNG